MLPSCPPCPLLPGSCPPTWRAVAIADGVTFQTSALASPASGTEIATDDAGADGHVQIVKLAIAANGSVTLLPGDATDGLLVNLGANNDVTLASGAEVKVTDGTHDLEINADGSVNISGSVTAAPVAVSTQVQASSGLTTASTNYTSGDVLGAGWTFTSMAAGAGEGGKIVGVALLDDGDVMGGCDLYLSSGSITFGTDNAAPSVSDADAAKLLGTVSLVFLDVGTSRIAAASNLSVPYHCDATSLYVYARTQDNNAFFAATDDLHLRLYYQVDP